MNPMLEAHKNLIHRLFQAQLANDTAAYSEILHDELSWQIMQFGEVGRPRDKQEMIALLGLTHENLGGGKWEKNIVGMTAEGQRIAVEATASMQLSNGNLYKQRYHYVYVIRDGRILEVREYMDTLAAATAFEGLQAVTKSAPRAASQ